MVKNPQTFKRKLLASSISTCLLVSAGAVVAQEAVIEEEILVRGFKAAQETAVNLKRNASGVVDGIVADDIGKLPDVTIADSLQRISGIQVRRQAGEADAVNVRGLPQVIVQMNGEQFMQAGAIDTVQPRFGDLPAQLFKGADVYKTSNASLGYTGITGTINLKTNRPFDFDEGLTTAFSAEVQQGAETSETDPVISGLANWKGDGIGGLLNFSYANVNLANYLNGFNGSDPVGGAGWVNGVNDWGAAQPYNSVAPQGWVAWNQVTERERMGINGSFQMDLGEGWELVADYFYADQEEYNRKVGLSATNRWQTLNWFTPQDTRLTGNSGGAAGTTSNEWLTYQSVDLNVLRLKSFTQNDSFHRTSRNVNIELNYDDGGKLTAGFRAVLGDAEQKFRHGYNEGDLSSWEGDVFFQLDNFYPASECGTGDTPVGDEGGCFVSLNPDGYSEDPQLSIDFSGEHPVWSGFDNPLAGGLGAGATVADYMANVDSYAVGAFSSENNTNADGDMRVFRGDMSYAFDQGFVTSVDAGIRLSQRAVAFERYHLFSPFYAGTNDLYPEGCYAQWKAVDIALESDICAVGEMVGGDFQPYTALPPTELYDHNNVIWMSDFGPVSGVPGVWAVDPRDYDDPEAFHNRVFGSTVKAIVPGNTYNVDFDELSYYAQLNFESGPVRGDFGVRILETELTVKQNSTGPTLPHGNTNTDVGDVVTKRDYTDVLPSLNVIWDISDDLLLRFGASENTTPLNLSQWGDGLAVNTTINNDPNDNVPDGVFTVSSATLNGNPYLNPWRSTNLDLSLEYYFGPASVLSFGYFDIDIESFPVSSTIAMDLPDSDGVVRRTTLVAAQVQGEGGSLSGFEAGAKLAFSDLTDASFIGDMGIDVNYTYTDAVIEGSLDIQGRQEKLPDNSENQFNFVVWYENDSGFQARIAANYRDDRLHSYNSTSGGLNLYQSPTTYIDLGVSYDITDVWTVYFNGSNVTQEYEDYYLEWEDQYAFQNYYEPRYTLGVRARF